MPSFRTKARAVDLLGKGQIADLPTAICELWKNGYDAYADDLKCDLYLRGYNGLDHHIFTLSDDGTGMSLKDIEEKWIVLGTDSRVRGSAPLTEEERLGKPPRIPLGEKGIGRLSVAYLGSPMLMITKKKGEECNALFMDWRILENYNLYLDDVDIPIIEFSQSDLHSDLINKLIDAFTTNFDEGNWDEHESLKSTILNDLTSMQISESIFDEITSEFQDLNNHGTKFIIFNPHDQLIELSETDISDLDTKEKSAVRYLRSSLSGIHNAFVKEPPFTTSFLLHDQNGVYDLISKQLFFNQEDISRVDHWVRGKFDEEGFFTGEIQIFNKISKHSFRPRRPPGKTPYGPLTIEFGLLEGDAKNSKLEREEWDEMQKKLDWFGGLYIYRDNFRVLPYGRTESDFLEFEERRSRSASYYYISHRRICGYIGVSRQNNPQLKDKAGREGFIVNKAYREFRKDLIEFFIDFSVRYLKTRTTEEREKEEIPTWREEQVEEIRKRNERLIKAEKKRSKMSKTRFNRELKEYSNQIEYIETDIIDLHSQLKEEKEKAVLAYNNISSLISQLDQKKTVLRKMKLVKPRRFKLTRNQTNKYYEYREKYNEVKKLVNESDKTVTEIQKLLSKENLEAEFKKKYEEHLGNIDSFVKDYEERFKIRFDELDKKLKDSISEFTELYNQKVGHLTLKGDEDNKEIEKRIEELEQIEESVLDEIEDHYESFIKHVEGLTFEIDDDLLVSWYKDQYEKIEEQVEAMYELAQLGMAIEIIDHQFNVIYSEMSSAIEFFEQYSSEKPEIEYNYKQLRRTFEHLETNHKLLTPLYRTIRRSKTEIKGSEIVQYLNIFFKGRFEKHRITLTSNESFDNYTFYTYESIIKPVFINIINNAIYWLIPVEDRKIEISLEDNKILIMNSGQKIEHADLENIFTLFFSRKPGGRGIGLYLARTNLHTIGYDIFATNEKEFNRLNGACFIINKLKHGEEK